MMKAPASVSRFFTPLRREALVLVLLSILVVVCFSAVATLSRLYHAQEESLAARWSGRGSADLKAGNFRAAADDFRGSLRYSHDGFPEQLGLAQALIGLGRVEEASVYLQNLWSVQPENGLVNLELARIAAGKNNRHLALRYYHNAIYASWDTDAEASRRSVRWELVKYLLNLGARTDAQSELISLSAEVGDNLAEQKNLGEYFLKVADYDHALTAYRLCLENTPKDVQALAGAGSAAFGMGNYTLAQRYLQQAADASPKGNLVDKESSAKLETASLALRMDPFRRQISDADRANAVSQAFQVAGERLQACSAAAAFPAILPSSQSLDDAWKQMQPRITRHGASHDANLVNQAMNLSFMIERQATSQCGAGSAADRALLLISKLHEGN